MAFELYALEAFISFAEAEDWEMEMEMVKENGERKRQ